MTLTARPVTLGDAAFLLRLRNDPATVAASRVQATVTAHDHIAWLERALADPTRRLMIVLGPWPTAVPGTYRLDGVGTDEIEVSLTVAPEHRGRGLARHVIELACRDAVTHGPEIIKAEVRVWNALSLVAFLKVGFGLMTCGAGFAVLTRSAEDILADACRLCAVGTPHHTNSASSIGRADDRHPVYDIHAVENEGGVGLQECEAGDLWLAWEGARRERVR